MKNMKNSICIVLLLIFAGGFVSYGQDSPKSVQEASEKLSKQNVKKDAKKQLKDADAKLSDQVVIKQSAVDQEKRDKELKKIKEKMDKVDNDEQRKELQEYYDKVKSADKDAKKEMKKEMKEIKKEAKAEGVETKKEAGLKGRELGNAKAEATIKKIEVLENGMSDRDAYIIKSRKKIALAKQSLQSQIDSGSLSEEEIDAKKVRIKKAEIRLNDYETNVKNSKTKFSDFKKNVSGYYQEN
jgi:hypothetical protein